MLRDWGLGAITTTEVGVAARLGLHTAVDNRRWVGVCAAMGLEASGFPGIGTTGPLRRGEPRLYWREWPPLEETQVVGHVELAYDCCGAKAMIFFVDAEERKLAVT